MDTPRTSQQEPEIIRAEGLGKVYPGHRGAAPSRALNGASLSIARSEFVAVIGRSGAGKSTLLRCLNLLVRPTEGRIFIAGEDVTHASGRRLRRVRQHVGMVFQQFNLVRRLTVLENVLVGRLRFCGDPIAWGLSLARIMRTRDREAAMSCLAQVGLADKAHQRADTLSGGQQQRVAIARTLAQEPEVILADEPIASLDPVSAASVMDVLRDIRSSRGIPVVVNLHQIGVARDYASRIIGMAHGRIVFDAAPDRLTDAQIDLIYTQHAPTELQAAVPVFPRRVPEVAAV